MLLEAVTIHVKDLEAARRLYSVLGLEFSSVDGVEGFYQAVMADGVKVILDSQELMSQARPGWKPMPGTTLGITFKLESPEELDSVCEAAVAEGARLQRGPWDAFWGQRYANLSDSEGNCFDLCADLPAIGGAEAADLDS